MFCSGLSEGSPGLSLPALPCRVPKANPATCMPLGGRGQCTARAPDSYERLDDGHAGHKDTALHGSRRHPGHPSPHVPCSQAHLSFSLVGPVPPSRRRWSLVAASKFARSALSGLVTQAFTQGCRLGRGRAGTENQLQNIGNPSSGVHPARHSLPLPEVPRLKQKAWLWQWP